MNKVKLRIVVVTLSIVAVVISYIFLAIRPIDYGNGFILRVGHFGTCSNSLMYTNCGEATHRIQSTVFAPLQIDANYCDQCWEKQGIEYYQYLTKEFAVSERSDIDDSKEATTAKICAEKAVRDALKSPATAKFCSYSEMTAKNVGGNDWVVTGYVDAENSFGAMLRENWTVKLTLTQTGFTNFTVDFE